MGAIHDKGEQKRNLGAAGTGWLRAPNGYDVVRISRLPPSAHAEWVEVLNAEMDGERIRSMNSRRMLRYNAVQLWQNLIRQGWRQVPPQW